MIVVICVAFYGHVREELLDIKIDRLDRTYITTESYKTTSLRALMYLGTFLLPVPSLGSCSYVCRPSLSHYSQTAVEDGLVMGEMLSEKKHRRHNHQPGSFPSCHITQS